MIIRRAIVDKGTWPPDSQPLLPLSTGRVRLQKWSPATLRLRIRRTLFTLLRLLSALCLFLILGQITAMPAIRAIQASQVDLTGAQRLPLTVKIVETILAMLSVAIVAAVYSLLIRRGTLMSTTAIYPRAAIEHNVGSLLSAAWPDHSGDVNVGQGSQTSSTKANNTASPKNQGRDQIQLLYLGRMKSDENSGLVAKGMLQTQASPGSRVARSPVWLTSGSPLTKTVVQLLIWEWVVLWLVVLMVIATLLYNGFFTGDLTIDSYPRLTIIILYTVGYCSHLVFVWRVISNFFTNVGAGAAWSLLERANFAVCHYTHLRRHRPGRHFSFSGIDKASKEHVPTVYEALFKHEADPANSSSTESPLQPTHHPALEDANVVRAALATIKASQENERDAARDAAAIALDRVVQNAMIVTGIILSSGFSSWTSAQTTDNSPNNFNSQQIGSLALLASLSLGAAAMFTSAMHLSVMESSFATILSLKETKINGQAVEHYKKRSATNAALSFMNHDSGSEDEDHKNTQATSHLGNLVPSYISFLDILAMNKVSHLLEVVFLGPAYALLPERKDHIRTSKNLQFELAAKVRNCSVVLTTQRTNSHTLNSEGWNVEAINVCAMPSGDEVEGRAAVSHRPIHSTWKCSVQTRTTDTAAQNGNVSDVLVSEKGPVPISETV